MIESGETASKAIMLISSGTPADRVLDISVQSRPPRNSRSDSEDEDEEEDDEQAEHVCEKLETIAISTISPFNVQHQITYNSRKGNSEEWDDSVEATVRTTWTCSGPWTLELEKVILVKKESEYARVVDSSIDEEEQESSGI